MRRVYRERGENRENIAQEFLAQTGFSVCIQVIPAHNMNVLFFQFGKYLLMEYLGVALLQAVSGGRDRFHLFVRTQPCGGRYRQSGSDAAFEPRHAHHKELVKVRGHDRKKIQALQQVQIRVFGKLQHPGIKIEPAAFTVEKTLGPKIAFDAGQIEFFTRLNAVGTGIGTLNLRDIVSDVNQPGHRCRFGILFGMRVGCHRLFLTMLRD